MRRKILSTIGIIAISISFIANNDVEKLIASPLYPDKIIFAGEEAVRLVKASKQKDSIPFWATLLDWQDKNLGTNDIRSINTLKNLSAIYLSLGRLDDAEKGYEKLRERLSSNEEQNILSILQVDIQRTFLMLMQNRYDDARKIGNDTLKKLRRQQRSKHTKEQIDLIEILASIDSEQGLLKEARAKLIEVLSLRKTLDAPNELVLASGINNLAQINKEMGLIAESINLQNDVLEIYRQNKSSVTPGMYSTVLSNLALSNKLLGQYDKGKEHMKEALKMRIKASGRQHPVTASLLLNFGTYEEEDGNMQEALNLYQESLEIMYDLSPPDLLRAGFALQRMAELARNTKNTSKAMEWGNTVLAIREKRLSENHPDIGTSLFHLGMTELQQNNPSNAQEYLKRALSIRKKSLDMDHPYTALTQLILGLINWDIDNQRGEIYLRDASRSYSKFIVDQAGKLSIKERLPLLNSFREAIDILYGFAVQGEVGKSIALEARLNLHGRLEEIEKRHQMFNQRKMKINNDRQIEKNSISQNVNVEMISTALQGSEALVEFIYYTPKILEEGILKQSEEEMVIAIILKSDGDITVVKLGSASTINQAIWKALIKTQRVDIDAQQAWNAVADLVLKPLDQHLDSSDTWYFSLDGELHRVPFAALELPETTDGVDRIPKSKIRIVTTARELLTRKVNNLNVVRSNLIIADPDYANTSKSSAIKASGTGAIHYIPNRWRKLQWNQLPGTSFEGDMIINTIGGKLFTNKEANIQNLTNTEVPRLLHIASHGAFLAKLKPLKIKSINSALEGRVVDWDDPMNRSVVLLAGVNNRNPSIQSNGYVMANEVSLLNLHGTDLVTISGCQTGVGSIEVGDGIYGLRRALSIAGAKATMLSLWKVDDRGTSTLMSLFYRYLSNGYSPEQSLKFSQASLRQHKNIEFRHPYVWASFQLYGQSWNEDE